MPSIALRGVIVEDFCNYKRPAMFLISAMCDWKCCHEANIDESVCQNHGLVNSDIKQFTYSTLYNVYQQNHITKAVVIGGLEPMLQKDEIIGLIQYFRLHKDNSPFIIYTGYNKPEIADIVHELSKFENIIIKFGRYMPNTSQRYDDVLGVTLASDNQYAEVIS